MPRHGPTDDAPAEHVEDDGQVQEAGQGRDVGDVGDPEPVRRVRLEAPLDPIRGRAGLGIPACRARAAAPAHPGDADGPHDPGDPLAAHRDTALGQFGVNPRSTIRPSTPAVNRLDASPELGIGPCPSRRRTTTPRVVPARGDTEHPGHRGDTETSLIRAHDPVGLPGRASRANQAVAFANISRSSHRRRFSRRSRRSSSRSSVRSPSLRSPASRPACATQVRIAWDDGSNSRARSSGARPDRTRSTICCRNSAAYGGSSSASRILLLPQELSTRRSRTHVCMKQGYRMG